MTLFEVHYQWSDDGWSVDEDGPYRSLEEALEASTTFVEYKAIKIIKTVRERVFWKENNRHV